MSNLSLDLPNNEQNDTLDCIEGTLETVTFHNEESGFTICRVRTDGSIPITVLCTFLSPPIGEFIQFWGRWDTHKQYGKQFRAERYMIQKPATPQAIERYLASGVIKGVGAKMAKILVRAFGEETIDILDKSPARLMEVPGIGKKKLEQIIKGWDEQRAVRHIMLYLQGHGISAAYAAKIYRQYGDSAIEQVTENPYQLSYDIWGIGFKISDRIARQIGMKMNANARVEAGVFFALQQGEENGNCYLPFDELVRTTTELLKVDEKNPQVVLEDAPSPDAVSDAIKRMVQRGLLILDKDGGDTPIYRKVTYILENTLATQLSDMLADEVKGDWMPADPQQFVDVLCKTMDVTLAKEQTRAVLESLHSRVLILTGGPGTGKTTTTRAILQALLDCKRTVSLASPTGRAAKRLAEVTGQGALTIHRLLEVDKNTFKFKRGPDNPLESNTLIVDEVSMVDLNLMYSLVRALRPDSQLILVGDADQLPSVGAGNVLADLINSGVIPVVRLTEVFRQAAASNIISNAHRINRGEMPHLSSTKEWQQSDCLFINQEDPQEAAKKIVDVVARSLQQLNFKREDIQVLIPMQKGAMGAQNLNEMLQTALNPKTIGVSEFTRGQRTYRNGDRVIQTSNNYEKEVFNGDIGYIRNIDFDEKEFVIEFPEKDVVYGFDETDDLSLAYALTVHKSQGSEYPAVVLGMHTQHYIMLQRNLLYTALTRAKKMAIIIGNRRAMHLAVSNTRKQERYTRLAARLIAKAGKAEVDNTE
jgi:exodeoxyribonuclease V alpha subunit